MNAIADGLLIAGAIGVAFYCFVLSRRLARFTDLERGVGGAVAVLSAQVDDLNRALDGARNAAETSGQSLKALTDRADGVARRLELQLASLQDVAEPDPITSQTQAPCAATATTAMREQTAPPTQSFFSRRAAGVAT